MTNPQPQKQLSECEACDYSFNCYHTPQCETIDQCDTKSHKKHKKSCGSFDPADCKYGNWCVDCVTPESPKSSQLEITDILVDNKAHSEEFRNGVVWAMEEMAKKKQLPSQLTEEDREDEMTFEEAEKFLKIASGPDEWANELSEFHQNNIQSFKEDLIEKWLEAYDKIKSREAEEKVKAEYVLGLEAGMGDRKNMIDEAVKKERERCAKIADSMDLSNDVITDGKLGEFYNKAFRYACEKIKSEILNPEPPKE